MIKYSFIKTGLFLFIIALVFSGYIIYPPNQGLLSYVNEKGKVKRVKTAEDWKVKRTQILYGMEQAMGKLPGKDYVYAIELALRGYVVIAPDYPSMGEAEDYDFTADPYVSGAMKGIFNHFRCVDFLQSLDCVIQECIGVVGHSLGGHNAIFAGVFDKRLKVVVSSCGWSLMDF